MSLNSVNHTPWHFAPCEEGYPGVCGMLVRVGEAELMLGLRQTNVIRELSWRNDPNGKLVKGTAVLDDAERADLTASGIELEPADNGRWRSVQPVAIDHFYRQVPGRLGIGK